MTAYVFLKIVQALPSYRFETTTFQAWLFQVARNLAIDHNRHTNAHPVVVIDENLDSGEDNDLDQLVAGGGSPVERQLGPSE